MTYEEFLDTVFSYEFANLHYDPELGIVYCTVDHGLHYRGEYYEYGTQVGLHLDTGNIHRV